MKKFFRLLLILIIGFVFSSSAQDKVYIKGQKQPLECKVLEIGLNEIKIKNVESDYYEELEKIDVVKIVFENGRTQVFQNAETNNELYNDQRKNILKLGMLSMASNSLALYYERSLRPGISMEFEGRMLGGFNQKVIGYNQLNGNEYYANAHGIRLGAGYKAIRLPDFVSGRIRFRHVLQGSYIKPVASLDFYRRNFFGDYYDANNNYVVKTYRKNVIGTNFGVEFGKQWIMGNSFSLDIFTSLGYSFNNISQINNKIKKELDPVTQLYYDVVDNVSNFGYLRVSGWDRPGGVIAGFGIKVGYLFNLKKDNLNTLKYK